MATHALQRNLEPKWNWLRISGLSGSFGLHVAALLLLALPVAIPTLKPEVVVITTTVFEKPIDVPVVKPPPEPEPKHLPRRQVQPVVVTRPVVEDSVMAVPVTMPVSEPAESTALPSVSDVTPSIASNASLAYESIIQPDYPRDARRRGEQGTVLLRVLVGRDGMPIEIAIEHSSGSRQLDRAAREAVLRWRFRPVRINGVTVPASGLVPIKFDINRG
jgi:protein TonB